MDYHHSPLHEDDPGPAHQAYASVGPTGITYAHAVASWLIDKKDTTTVIKYREALRDWILHCSATGRDLWHADTTTVRSWTDHLAQQGYKPRTSARYQATLSSLARHFEENHLTTTPNPWPWIIRPPHEEVTHAAHLSKPRKEALIDRARHWNTDTGPRTHLALLLLADARLTPADTLAANTRHLTETDDGRTALEVTDKWGTPTRTVLTPRTAHYLQEYLASADRVPAADGTILTGPTGRPVIYRTLHRHIRAVAMETSALNQMLAVRVTPLSVRGLQAAPYGSYTPSKAPRTPEPANTDPTVPLHPHPNNNT